MESIRTRRLKRPLQAAFSALSVVAHRPPADREHVTQRRLAPLDTETMEAHFPTMNTAVGSPKKVWTEAEIEALPDDGFTHEIVDGELVMSPKHDWYHGDICADLLAALRTFANARRLGAVWDSSTGLWMFSRNCRAPDISFVVKARLAGHSRRERKFFPGAPDLAVEVLSPNNSRTEISERLKEFFASGTQIAWIIDPDRESVEVCYAPDRRRLLGPGADLDGEHLLPGFRYPIGDLFKEWNWE